jgi:hypothetical protein
MMELARTLHEGGRERNGFTNDKKQLCKRREGFVWLEVRSLIKKREVSPVECPHLLEWTAWKTLFCKLRYEKPDVLNSSEITDYCKSENHINCIYLNRQICRNQEKQ